MDKRQFLEQCMKGDINLNKEYGIMKLKELGQTEHPTFTNPPQTKKGKGETLYQFNNAWFKKEEFNELMRYTKLAYFQKGEKLEKGEYVIFSEAGKSHVLLITRDRIPL